MTLDQILEALNEREAKGFHRALATLEQYEAEPVILKSELGELRSYGLNRGFEHVWKTLISEIFSYSGKWESLNGHEQKLNNSILYPEIHTAVGMLKRVTAARQAEGPMRSRMIEVLEVLAPIAVRTNALKDKIGQRPPKTTKTSMEREERDAKAMTCQICARGILAETGLIAHHGYERPGTGYLTDSCEGARKLPFEVSRDVLTDHLVGIRDRITRMISNRAEVLAESIDIPWDFEDRTHVKRQWENGISQRRAVNRQTFDTVKAETASMRKGRQDRATFDTVKDALLVHLDHRIENLQHYEEHQTERHKAWQGPTHERVGDAWVKLDKQPGDAEEPSLADAGLVDAGLAETGLVDAGSGETGLTDAGSGDIDPEVPASAAPEGGMSDPGTGPGVKEEPARRPRSRLR